MPVGTREFQGAGEYFEPGHTGDQKLTSLILKLNVAPLSWTLGETFLNTNSDVKS